MIKLIENDTRRAVAFLNYKNRISADTHTPLGPNEFGEYLWPVEISENGKRIGLSFQAPKEEE